MPADKVLTVNKKARPDFDYTCECGFWVCNTCGYPLYPMEVHEDRICEECEVGVMMEVER